MITSNVLNRVFFVRGSQYGTAFTVDVDGDEYLVSARHLFEEPDKTTSILLMHDRKWMSLNVTVVGVGRGELDIVVFKSRERLTPPEFAMEATDRGVVFGQDLYFAGYPYKMWADMGPAMNSRAAPFVKKGTFSSGFDLTDGIHRIYVDAINNEGFSGGPLIFSPPGATLEYRVMGVVSRYRTEYEQVLNVDGEPTDMKVSFNTGFLLAYGIQHVLKLIEMSRQGKTSL